VWRILFRQELELHAIKSDVESISILDAGKSKQVLPKLDVGFGIDGQVDGGLVDFWRADGLNFRRPTSTLLLGFRLPHRCFLCCHSVYSSFDLGLFGIGM